MDIDLLLPFRIYSINEFIETAAAIRGNVNDPNALSNFERFVLTGRHELERHQAQLDPILNRLPDNLPVHQTRDYDTLIGLSDNIQIRGRQILVLPVACDTQTLTAPVHLRMRIKEHDVALHLIPNVHFGTWGVQYTIRLFFPGLWTPNRARIHLSNEERAELYDKGIRPAVENLQLATDWPASYLEEILSMSDNNGVSTFSTYPLSEDSLEEFGDSLRSELRDHGVDWAMDFKFMHYLHAVDGSTRHDQLHRKHALAQFLRSAGLNILLDNHNNLRCPDDDEWWIDVGLEVAHQGHCLEWRTDSHASVVECVLRTTREQSQEITSFASPKYRRDLSTHLIDVSGCRIEHVQLQDCYTVAFLQMSTTDKSPTYYPCRRVHGKAIRGNQILTAKEPPALCHALYDVYRNAARHHDSSARIHVVVPLQYGLSILRSLPDDVIRQSLLLFERAVWWNYRGWLLLAATEVLALQISGSGKFRARLDALLLTAGLVWYINGIHSRPLEGRCCRDLIRAILPHTDNPLNPIFADQLVDEEMHEEETGPWAPCSIIFFRDLMLPDVVAVPRMRTGRSISDETVRFFFGDDRRKVVYLLDPVGIQSKEDIPTSRFPTRKGITASWCGDNDANCFDLAARGYALPPPQIDGGDDLAVEDAEMLNDPPDATLDSKLSAMWYQFLADMIQKAPNPKGSTKPSYCLIPDVQRYTVNDEFYQGHTLSRIWRVCQYQMASLEVWSSAFTHFWPRKGHVLSPTAQNFASCQYFQQWKRFITDCPDDVAAVACAAVKEKFDQLYWIPAPSNDKMWNTNKARRGFTTLPRCYMGPAPQLLVKGPGKPIWARNRDQGV